MKLSLFKYGVHVERYGAPWFWLNLGPWKRLGWDCCWYDGAWHLLSLGFVHFGYFGDTCDRLEDAHIKEKL